MELGQASIGVPPKPKSTCLHHFPINPLNLWLVSTETIEVKRAVNFKLFTRDKKSTFLLWYAATLCVERAFVFEVFSLQRILGIKSKVWEFSKIIQNFATAYAQASKRFSWKVVQKCRLLSCDKNSTAFEEIVIQFISLFEFLKLMIMERLKSSTLYVNIFDNKMNKRSSKLWWHAECNAL